MPISNGFLCSRSVASFRFDLFFNLIFIVRILFNSSVAEPIMNLFDAPD